MNEFAWVHPLIMSRRNRAVTKLIKQTAQVVNNIFRRRKNLSDLSRLLSSPGHNVARQASPALA